MKKMILIGVLAISVVVFLVVGTRYFSEKISLFHELTKNDTNSSTTNNYDELKDSTKIIVKGKLPYLTKLPILDKALYFEYYYNSLLFGGVNIFLVKLAARQQNGDILKYKRDEDKYLIEFDITKEPYIEFSYKNEYYSFSVTGVHHSYTYVLKEIKNTTLILNGESKIIELPNIERKKNGKTQEPQHIIDWILKNKEWLFSGIGIFLIVSILKVISFLKKTNKTIEKLERIAQKYVDILDGKTRGHSGIPGLIECGAAELKNNKQLLKLVNLIKEHGKPNPLANWLLNHIEEKDALKFIKWQAQKDIKYSPYYFNENNFIKLVNMYKSDLKST